ncbi:MAG: prepilin-type N-terminal cleavage/methylation domain-containing protein [Burkholderiales bacterium]|nr:prepilin-type N-terminal cleavage/methylation domain-containing protein [Burkholderiales bacterium]
MSQRTGSADPAPFVASQSEREFDPRERSAAPSRPSATRRYPAQRGMTLVEIMIALAIAALMTLTGWRAIDALQTARDRVVADATQWQRLDDFFVTLEADLRRAAVDEFSGDTTSLTIRQPALDGSGISQLVRYRWPVAGAIGPSIVRESSTGHTPMSDVTAATVTYSADGVQFVPALGQFPRALRVAVLLPGAAGPVERTMALR